MNTFDWQQQLEKRRRRTKYERIGALVLLVFALGFFLWRFFYADTPEYALDKLSQAIETQDAEAVQKYCDLDTIIGQAYNDLTRDMFALDDQLSTDTKVMFEQFYVKIKPLVQENTKPLILAYISTGTWQQPGGDNILKGRMLGIDYEYLIQRSQLRNISLEKIDSVDRNGDSALAKIQIKENTTNTLFTLNLLMSKREEGWQVVKLANYRDFLDFIAPIQESGLQSYVKDTQDIIDKYDDIMDTQQDNFNIIGSTSDGVMSSDQRKRLADYIKSDIVPAIEKRQKELDAVAVADGAQYLQSLRSQETQLALLQWQHYLNGLKNDDLAELNTAQAFHKNGLDLQHRIDDVIKNKAISRVSKTIP